MRKILLIFALFFLLLSGCLSETEKQEENSQEVILEEQEPSKEVVEIEKEDNVTKKDEEVSVDEEEQKKDFPLYMLQSDHTVKPMNETESERVVLLTIDDAPNKYSVEMARLLKEKNINAIFFVNGHFINNEVGREKLKTIHDLGFEIGNHTMNHPNLKKLSEEEQRQEILALNDLIEEITGERPRFFRAPFGVNTDVSRQLMTEESMQWMNWTYGYDFEKKYMEKDALVDIMVNTNLLRPGANLLMHDHPWTLEALPLIITGLQEKGYEFVDPKAIQ